nr:hypothetical protein [Tanacetum cinerariifolium]
MTTSVVNNPVFRGFFEKQKLTGPHFIDWYRQLRIVLLVEDKLNYLENPIPPAPIPAQDGQQVAPEALAAHATWVKGSKEITVRDSHSCKQDEKESVSSYVLKMKSYIDNLERLGHPVLLNLGVSLILISLRKEFDSFVQNYNMHGMRKTVNELHALLKLHEQNLPKKDAHALHGLKGSRKLKPGALSLYVGNGQRAVVEAIRSFHLCLPSGLVIVLNNCHYAPSVTRGIILVFCLYDDGFIKHFVDNAILVSKNNLVYFIVFPRDGIFEIDLCNYNINNSSMYDVSNKKAKLNLDSALLWHCRLGQISKKRIEKLQHDGLLNSTDHRAFEKYVSCVSGKMARKPYTHQVKRAKDLLGLIQTDHKHEVFDTFKVFQKEVKKQLRKTIKLLHSDRGGENMSQEFFDHLKEHVIISHCTPPYTPQHNGVSERRNRTLLDKVRSMKSQTTLPKSFWDYALEITARILNMVSTKKVEKTPYESMKDNEVWVLVNLPTNGKTVSSKWLFKKKTDMDGAVHTYKAHIRAIRILIAITVYYDYEIWQIDVKTAFLNGHLSEEVYIEQPEGFVNPKYSNHVCKLKRSIYGLKKASRQWNKRFDDEIKKFSFTQNRDEPYAYLKASGSNITFLILYVDDILIMGNNILMLQDVKSYLGRCFAMKDLGEATYFLGITIYRDRSRRLIGLCQSAYIEKILKRFHMKNTKRGSIPMQEKLKLSKSQGASTPAELKRMQNVLYVYAVGSIMYAGSCYTDAGYLTDADDLKSQTGYVFVLNRGDVDWKSTKQSIFETSSAEANYIVTYDVFKKAVWVRKFISGLGVVPIIEDPIKMYCDTTGAIAIANESGITKGARHFRAKVHYLREVIEYGDIKLEKVHTYDNLADPFTKAFAFLKLHTKNIGMLSASSLIMLLKEDIEAYTWLLKSFMTTHEKQPTMVVTDQDGAMKRAIEAVLTESKHRLCMWHIMQKVPAKICPEIYDETNFKERFEKLVWNMFMEPLEFKEKWSKLVEDFG